MPDPVPLPSGPPPDFDYTAPQGPLRLLHEDAQIIVIDKPPGLLSVPGKLDGRDDCLQARLTQLRWDALLVHRLDADTSGVMVFARTKAAQGHLGQEFEKRRAAKTYIALVAGQVEEEGGRLDWPIGADWENRPRQKIDAIHGRPSVTLWQRLGREGAATRLRLTPLTGRSHQLRVHLAAMGHPILGDPIYATGADAAGPRLMLHAERLEFHHPGTGRRVAFEVPPGF
jgi:tRNA pseudouridine32 synthase / 23S rRNA pseudouridine746 synthase